MGLESTQRVQEFLEFFGERIHASWNYLVLQMIGLPVHGDSPQLPAYFG